MLNCRMGTLEALYLTTTGRKDAGRQHAQDGLDDGGDLRDRQLDL